MGWLSACERICSVDMSGRCRSGRGCERVAESTVALLQGRGNDAGACDGLHEVDIPVPAGDDVKVEVARDAGAGSPADVDADVEALSVTGLAEQSAAAFCGLHHIGASLRGEVRQGDDMGGWSHEQVAVGIGEPVEHQRGVGALVEDQAIGGLLVGQVSADGIAQKAAVASFEGFGRLHIGWRR